MEKKHTWLIVYFLIASIFSAASFAANNQAIEFPDACAKGDSIIIAAVGDVLLHTPLQEKASLQGFESLWDAATFYIKQADIAYANIEGPIAKGMKRAGDDRVYSSFPYFNYPEGLAYALKQSGFDIVSTANNHALDRFSQGIDKTIDALDKAGLTYVGTRKHDANRPWFRITTKDAFKIAWIACAETTNDNPDNKKQVLYCYKKRDRQEIFHMIKELKTNVDAIIILPHWGEEYHTLPTEEQVAFAHQLLEAGATAVIGSHPHVLQPLQKYMTKDGRATLIAYSLGNFVSYQGDPIQRSTIILLLGLTKKSTGTVINGVRFVPMYMQNRSGLKSIQLTKPTEDDQDLLVYKIISNVMPMENALFSTSVVTHSGCASQNNTALKR